MSLYSLYIGFPRPEAEGLGALLTVGSYAGLVLFDSSGTETALPLWGIFVTRPVPFRTAETLRSFNAGNASSENLQHLRHDFRHGCRRRGVRRRGRRYPREQTP